MTEVSHRRLMTLVSNASIDKLSTLKNDWVNLRYYSQASGSYLRILPLPVSIKGRLLPTGYPVASMLRVVIISGLLRVYYCCASLFDCTRLALDPAHEGSHGRGMRARFVQEGLNR